MVFDASKFQRYPLVIESIALSPVKGDGVVEGEALIEALLT
jgi:hypothetical protein